MTPDDALYDEAHGPRPLTRRRVPCEWDDPTWLAVCIDRAWMAEQTWRAEHPEWSDAALDALPPEVRAALPYAVVSLDVVIAETVDAWVMSKAPR